VAPCPLCPPNSSASPRGGFLCNHAAQAHGGPLARFFEKPPSFRHVAPRPWSHPGLGFLRSGSRAGSCTLAPPPREAGSRSTGHMAPRPGAISLDTIFNGPNVQLTSLHPTIVMMSCAPTQPSRARALTSIVGSCKSSTKDRKHK
jgi:hypothetical protein